MAAKKRILTACVRLFIERGYNGTTVAEIIKEADVSASSFQNIFRSKDGVLSELAACGEVPSVGLSYDPKVSGCAQYLGISCVDFDEVTAQGLIDEIDAALSETGADMISRRFEYIKNVEKMNIETAKRLLGE